MTTADIKAQLVAGKQFTFNPPGRNVTLVVVSNDGSTLIGNIVGKEPDQIIWSLDGLTDIPGLHV